MRIGITVTVLFTFLTIAIITMTELMLVITGLSFILLAIMIARTVWEDKNHPEGALR